MNILQSLFGIKQTATSSSSQLSAAEKYFQKIDISFQKILDEAFRYIQNGDYRNNTLTLEEILKHLQSQDAALKLTVLIQAGALMMEGKPRCLRPYIVAIKDPDPFITNTILLLLMKLAMSSSGQIHSRFKKAWLESGDSHDLDSAMEDISSHGTSELMELVRMVRLTIQINCGSFGRTIRTETHTSTSIEPNIKIDDKEFELNNQVIPNKAKIGIIFQILGQPSRIEKRQLGTIYVCDDLGITYRTDPNSTIVTSLTLYFTQRDLIFLPKQFYKKPFFLKGIVFPYNNNFTEILGLFPDLVNNRDEGTWYTLALGSRKIGLDVERRTGVLNYIEIILGSKTK